MQWHNLSKHSNDTDFIYYKLDLYDSGLKKNIPLRGIIYLLWIVYTYIDTYGPANFIETHPAWSYNDQYMQDTIITSHPHHMPQMLTKQLKLSHIISISL